MIENYHSVYGVSVVLSWEADENNGEDVPIHPHKKKKVENHT